MTDCDTVNYVLNWNVKKTSTCVTHQSSGQVSEEEASERRGDDLSDPIEDGANDGDVAPEGEAQCYCGVKMTARYV